MFESLEIITLQQYWWIIISLLGALLVFLMFVQGGQTLIYTIGKTELERTMLINTLGRKWEFTFTTLVTFGGAFFAAFPLFYSTSFGGAYWAWMIILFAFVLQAISYEFRSRKNNFLGHKTYELFLFINGLIGTTLIGVAVGSFFTGSPFYINDMNQSSWKTSLHGLDLTFNFQNMLLGASVFLLGRILGLLYFINSIDDTTILQRSRKHLLYNFIPFILTFVSFTVVLLVSEGFAYDTISETVSLVKYKYFTNLIELPIVAFLFIAGVSFVLYGIITTIAKENRRGIWISGTGTILTVFALFLIAGLNNTSFYPSTYDLQSSLTISNASSSKFTLTVMSYTSLLIPFVIAYIWYAWKAINKTPIDKEEMESDDIHIY